MLCYPNFKKILTLISGFSGQRSNYFILVNGQKEGQPNDGTFPVTAEVADFGNPTHTCQKLADFPDGDDWFPRGGWVDGVLIICSTKSDKKCYKLSDDGK